MKNKQTNKQTNKQSKKKKTYIYIYMYIHVKTSQNKGVLNKRIKETKAEKVELGLLGFSMCTHTQGLRMQPICMHMHTCLKTLTQKHRNAKNRGELKTINLTTEHALKQKARKPKLKQTCYITNKPRKHRSNQN